MEMWVWKCYREGDLAVTREGVSGAGTTLPGRGVVVVVKQSEGNQTETESQDMTERGGRWREGRVLERDVKTLEKADVSGSSAGTSNKLNTVW